MADENENEEVEDKQAMVPSHRLRSVTKVKNQAQQQVGDLQGQVTTLEQQVVTLTKRAETADTLAQQVKDLQAAHVIDQAGWAEERGIYHSGITDPEAIGVARLFHGQLPEADRPVLGDWLKGFADDASKAPKGLQPYLPGPDPDPSSNQDNQQSDRPKNKRKPASGQPAVTGQWTAERLAEVRHEAERTGDFTELKTALTQSKAEHR